MRIAVLMLLALLLVGCGLKVTLTVFPTVAFTAEADVAYMQMMASRSATQPATQKGIQ